MRTFRWEVSGYARGAQPARRPDRAESRIILQPCLECPALLRGRITIERDRLRTSCAPRRAIGRAPTSRNRVHCPQARTRRSLQAQAQGSPRRLCHRADRRYPARQGHGGIIESVDEFQSENLAQEVTRRMREGSVLRLPGFARHREGAAGAYDAPRHRQTPEAQAYLFGVLRPDLDGLMSLRLEEQRCWWAQV